MSGDNEAFGSYLLDDSSAYFFYTSHLEEVCAVRWKDGKETEGPHFGAFAEYSSFKCVFYTLTYQNAMADREACTVHQRDPCPCAGQAGVLLALD